MMHDFSLVFEIDNEYWQRVLDIFAKSESYPKKVVSKRNLHHKFPRSFSKILGEPIDNDKDNLISLSLADHFLVHYYYYLLAKKGFRQSMATAFTFMAKKCLKYVTPETAEAMAQDYAEAKAIALQGPNNPFYGHHHTDESKKKLSDANKGHVPSEETRKKLSEACAGEKNGFYGKRHTEETIKKMSDAAKGRKPTAETKLKQSLSHKGRPSKLKGTKFTEERRQKHKEAIKLWWSKRKQEKKEN